MNIKLIGLAAVCALAIAAPSLGGGTPIVAKALAVGTMKATTIHATTGVDDPRLVSRSCPEEASAGTCTARRLRSS